MHFLLCFINFNEAYFRFSIASVPRGHLNLTNSLFLFSEEQNFHGLSRCTYLSVPRLRLLSDIQLNPKYLKVEV